MSSDNVFSALEEIEFENFIEPLREALELFRKMNKEKKSKANDGKTGDSITANNNDQSMNDDAVEQSTDDINE